MIMIEILLQKEHYYILLLFLLMSLLFGHLLFLQHLSIVNSYIYQKKLIYLYIQFPILILLKHFWLLIHVKMVSDLI